MTCDDNDDALISCHCFLCVWLSTQNNHNFDNLHARLQDMIFDEVVNDSQKHFKAISYFKVISIYKRKVYYNIREFKLMKQNIFFFSKKKKGFFKKKRQIVFTLWSIRSSSLHKIGSKGITV